ncbi:MAG TPA: conjugal transfer protein TraG, partial [Thermodesulfobacteriaceae bacterium]|nr:conjugal transfer protein TraG [Thermodesulfobacteriaceae bacterium]
MPLDLSITVHGEFELARQVLVYLSTIINSSAYKGLVTTLFILVFTLMLMSGMLEVLFGNFRTFDSWVKAFFTGVFIYAIFLSGAARVTVYDDITGRSYTQGNIPPGIALMMWFPNRIATGIEDLVRSYLAPSLPLSPFAYEHGVSMIREAYNGKLVAALSQVIPNQVWRSAGAYVEDCVALEAARSASYESKLYYGDNPYLAWGDAINYFFYTYTSLDASGRPFPPGTPDENVSCAEAWNRLNAYFRSDDWTTATRYFCKLMSLGDDNISVTACLDLMQEVFSRYITNGVTRTPEEIAKNVFAGVVYYNFLASLDSSIAVGRVAAYSRAQAELMGRGIVAQDWIPIMKTVFFIFACALIPLVFLFIATGTGGVKYLIGLFVWWMIWCGADAVVYCLWVTRAEKLFEVVSDGGKLGLAGLQDLWFLSSKALALLGSMRSLGFLIAGTMTYALFRFGGAALAHMATILGGTVSASAPKVAGYTSP